MKKTKEQLLGICMMLFMCVTFFCMSETVEASGKVIQCGDNVYATLDELGTLTISGTGDMWDYSASFDSSPFFGEDIYKVVIKEGVTSIGSESFCGIVERWDPDIKRYICDFEGCENIQSVSISNTVKTIGKEAFAECTALRSIVIPGSVQKIDKGAFKHSGLKSCTLNVGLKTIGENAFQGTWLNSIVIPEGVSSVEKYAFDTSILKNVTIPRDIAIIKAYAFPSNVKATIYSTDVTIGENAFGSGSVLIAERNSTADVYVANHSGITIQYFQYPSTVRFDANGGSVSTTSKKILSETYYGTLPVPTRKGYTFLGWFTEKNGGTQILSSTMVTTKTDSILYARWKKLSVKTGKKPTLISTKAGRMTVKIKKISGVNGYQIQYSKKSNMKSAKKKFTTSNKITIKNLSKGKTYYVKVRAYKLDSCGKKVYGKWGTKAKIRIKK